MVQNYSLILEEKLNEFLGQNVTIIQDGFIQSCFMINNLKFIIEYEILNIFDESSNFYLKINLNQVYKIDFDDKNIKLFLDYDTTIALLLKR